jgi:hypothetical protein
MEVNSFISVFEDNSILNMQYNGKSLNRSKIVEESVKNICWDSLSYFRNIINSDLSLTEGQIESIIDIKLLLFLANPDKNKGITFENLHKTDINKRIKIFKRLYKENFIKYTPFSFLKDYFNEYLEYLYNINVDKLQITDFYKQNLKYLYSLAEIENNGIRIVSDSSIKFIKPEYIYDLSATGRLLNKKPFSLQNLPADSPLRKLLISRFENGIILRADWNAVDLRVAFAIAKQPIQALDLHREIAKLIFEKDEISESERKTIKELNFGLIYDSGSNTIASKLGISSEEVKPYLSKFYNTFTNLHQLKLDNKSFVYENGYTESYFGRKRFIEKTEYTKFFNSKIQMTSSDICLRALYFLQKEFKKNNLESKVIPYIVYDNLGFDIKQNELEKAKEIIKNCMEKLAPGDLSDYVNFPVKFVEGDTL